MKERNEGGAFTLVPLQFEYSEVGDFQIVLMNAEKIFESVSNTAIITWSLTFDPANGSNLVECFR